jgi:hypothetical protein
MTRGCAQSRGEAGRNIDHILSGKLEFRKTFAFNQTSGELDGDEKAGQIYARPQREQEEGGKGGTSSASRYSGVVSSAVARAKIHWSIPFTNNAKRKASRNAGGRASRGSLHWTAEGGCPYVFFGF